MLQLALRLTRLSRESRDANWQDDSLSFGARLECYTDMAPSRIESSFELNCELESSLRVGSTRFVELTVELDSIEFEFRAQFLKLDSTRSESS